MGLTSMPTELSRPVAGDIELGRTEVDPSQLEPSQVEGQVPAGTDCDLQYLAGRLRACPSAAITEQEKIVEARVAVIAWRVPFHRLRGRSVASPSVIAGCLQ
jgi:hypothetical protein